MGQEGKRFGIIRFGGIRFFLWWKRMADYGRVGWSFSVGGMVASEGDLRQWAKWQFWGRREDGSPHSRGHGRGKGWVDGRDLPTRFFTPLRCVQNDMWGREGMGPRIREDTGGEVFPRIREDTGGGRAVPEPPLRVRDGCLGGRARGERGWGWGTTEGWVPAFAGTREGKGVGRWA